MSTPRLLALCCAATFAFAASAASAQSASVGVSAETGTATRDVSDRFCLRQTGTRINSRIRAAATATQDGAKSDRQHCALGPGRSYTREDINMTGRVDLADALRALDPSIR